MTSAEVIKQFKPYIKLKQSGRTLIGLCPFHQERTPSFTIHPTLEFYHCFGCGKGGLLDGLLWELKQPKKRLTYGNH